MNILIIGDVVGSPGRGIMKKALPIVLKKYDVEYCIANVENAAGGFGVTREICDEFLAMGVDCMTSGNHIWDKKEIIHHGDHPPPRPPPPAPAPRQLPDRAARALVVRRPGQGLGDPRGHPEPERPRVH